MIPAVNPTTRTIDKLALTEAHASSLLYLRVSANVKLDPPELASA
ncbi:hypothetical protein [Altericista sp. CCNU0014]